MPFYVLTALPENILIIQTSIKKLVSVMYNICIPCNSMTNDFLYLENGIS